MSEDIATRGPLLGRMISIDKSLNMPFEKLLTSKQAEVYYLHKNFSPERENQFYMVTADDILIKIAVTGEPLSLQKKKGRYLETVLERTPQGSYHLYRTAFPVNEIKSQGKRAEQIFELLVNYISKMEKTVRNPEAKDIAKHFQILAYDSLVARFNSLETMQTIDDIIPDQSPRTVVVKAGEGCINKCAYCKLSQVDFKPYTVDQFVQHLKDTKEAHLEILGKEGTLSTNEGFINISDVLLLDLYNKQEKTDLTALKAAKLMRQHFPWLQKIGSFVGTLSALKLSEDSKGLYSLGKKRYSPNFFKRLLNNDKGIIRLYLGIETAHAQGSYLLAKKITYEEKKLAAQLINNASIGLKVIIQLGVLGKGFYYTDEKTGKERLVPWYKAIDETIRWINEVQPYRVMESVWQNYEELPINRLIKEGKIIPYDDPIRQIQRERKRLRDGIKVDWRINKEEMIEPKYERFLSSTPKKFIVLH